MGQYWTPLSFWHAISRISRSRWLVARARSGVSVFFLYDEIGSIKLPDSYLQVMRDAGIAVSGFKTTKGRSNRFQINFRNHRKLLVADDAPVSSAAIILAKNTWSIAIRT